MLVRAHRKRWSGDWKGRREMKPGLTRQQILDRMTQLRSEYEMVRRKTKELVNRTTRLYLAIEDLKPDSRKMMNNGEKIVMSANFEVAT